MLEERIEPGLMRPEAAVDAWGLNDADERVAACGTAMA